MRSSQGQTHGTVRNGPTSPALRPRAARATESVRLASSPALYAPRAGGSPFARVWSARLAALRRHLRRRVRSDVSGTCRSLLC